MKLQHLAVIFIIIMLPMSLIISAYTQMQIDTLVLQQEYDTKLMNATYDAMKAFEINTTNNNLSNISDTLRSDISAAISTFMTSFASSMGVPGYQDEYIKPYVPAILFTLYDGYYIYAPSLTINEKGKREYKYMLQPYNYYSVRYKRGETDIVVNYTLNNYIVIYGKVKGEYVVKSGYLINGRKNVDTKEIIKEYVPVAQLEDGKIKNKDSVQIKETAVTDSQKYGPNSKTDENGIYLYERNETYYIDPKSAKNYYDESLAFTKWVNDNLSSITASDAVRNNEKIAKFAGDNAKIFKIDNENDPEVYNSAFNQHRMDIIQDTVEDNLNYVITAYANYSGEDSPRYNFRMPQLESEEWVTISSNISMVSFVQGMPVGSRFYNNYSIVTSTNNKFFVDPENIYYIDYNVPESNRYYHKIDCPHLNKDSNSIKGFSNYNFQPFYVHIIETDTDIYYWKRREKACYYCIVGNNYTSDCGRYEDTRQLKISELSSNKQNAYYTAVAREKYRQYKTTEYFGK